ncbi:putative HTH-type transcriptional regulator LrhA [Candidatus Terasakiella magnetica]|uniref:Putative HTH-type transcriptional regulator LrhA n=1 Tax=Candidatus Terasakiella magnetica TaxID=1867952 RepID=A0A1C3RGU8_9PROT|nr:LysR substrate-binding domain-containing protein [Candidatus Terasakiella magnetica]SCA56523.1 putative HTH-type transcriptional regulator LrhA [Candidatus Terasakiella magnetica]
MEHLDLTQLRTFVAVAEQGSFAQAAEVLDLSAPTVSLQMKKLEENVHISLFNSQGRGKTITDAGYRFLEQARKMLSINDVLLSECDQLSAKGRVRIGTTQDFAETKLLSLLKSFKERNPNIQIDLNVDMNRNIHKAFEEGKLDIAIAGKDPKADNGGETIFKAPLVWICAEDFHLPTESSLPLVLFHEPCIVRDLTLDYLNQAGLPWHLSSVSPSLQGVFAATRAGFGVTARTRDQLSEGLREATELTFLPQLPNLEIALYTHKSTSSNKKVIDTLTGLVRTSLFS